MACFRMVPLYVFPRHRAINLFLKSYRSQWLEAEEPGHSCLIEDITFTKEGKEEEAAQEEEAEEQVEGPQPLKQLITAFSRAATTMPLSFLQNDPLYVSYAKIMSQSCHGTDDDEEEEGGEEGEDAAASFQEQEMEKQKLLFEQSRLSDRGAAEMILMYISASKGQWSGMANAALDLGISILRGGNVGVQKLMLEHLKEKKDEGFFLSVAGLMQQCSVLNLDAFERTNKAEGLGATEASSMDKNLNNAGETCKLFRFLQLLCEGHNLDFQNYLRSQAGNTTTVNIIICTVDYLLRLQESIMDFFWHYSGQDTIDEAGKSSFFRAIKVAGQVFASITEFIQGPCTGNQLALAHSRLWDAVGGFLFLFAHMQDKLSRDPEQLELLREFMKLQKDMMIMMLSMLEGNVVNGPIGKQMVDTLVESSANFEMILKFFDIFLKMKDLTSSEAFMEFDVNKDGVISHKEFRRAMESQKLYTEEEIEYVMMCVDANQDGKVDFNEFTDRFHNPAKDIGFNVAVLLTNLSEHMPCEPRLERFLEKARSVLDYFEPYLGRIEIMGGEGRIERVYFEIKQSNIDQWEKPQIKDSKRAFLHDCVNEEGDKGKLEYFINFCEDTIFEMQHATSLSAEEQGILMPSYAQQGTSSGVMDMVKTGLGAITGAIGCVLSCLKPSNIRSAYHAYQNMTWKEIAVLVGRVNLSMVLLLLNFLFNIVWTFGRFMYIMLRGDYLAKPEKPKRAVRAGRPLSYFGETEETMAAGEETEEGTSKIEAFGVDITKETMEDGEIMYTMKAKEKAAAESSGSELSSEEVEGQMEVDGARPDSLPLTTKSAAPSMEPVFEEEIDELAGLASEPPLSVEAKGMAFGQYILSMFARNFYNFKLLALALAFAINFILLFFKVSSVTEELAEGLAGNGDDAADVNSTEAEDPGGEEDDMDLPEFMEIPESVYYLGPLLRLMCLLHSLTAFSMMVAYYCLKVPLVVFKREKEISRSLEFEGMWVSEQPADDDIRGHWDKLVISTRSFPDKYWDKFVKKKVRQRYSEQYDYDQISNLLGMEQEGMTGAKKESSFIPAFIRDIDWQYQLWKLGIIFTDNSFLYLTWYFILSILGHYNQFFYAAHLLDVAVCFKTLGTILQSVTHNGKQLVLTVMLLSIIVYVYTAIAFNFFRKFYVADEDMKCHDMFTCYVFHMYVGVRQGGGIGDAIEPPDGDPYEVWRILFDITFFFFVIIILLAIIQGLIIDAFGELRSQLEQVKSDLESSCFICSIGKDYFDSIPHGFETHVSKEHNFANYMFFLMHLINKPETEYTGQESFVWNLYQQRCWDFIPVGDCFRKQNEEALGLGGSTPAGE